MNTVLVVDNVVMMVLGFYEELFLITYVVLLREDFMVSTVDQMWFWGSSKMESWWLPCIE